MLSSSVCYSQNSKINLFITDKVIYAQNGNIEINTCLSNNKDLSYILYNYLAVSNPIAMEKYFQTTDVTAGLVIYLKDCTGHFIPMEYPLGEPVPGHPAETLCADIQIDSTNNEYIKKMIFLKGNSSFKNRFCFDLYYSGVKKGTYKLYLFYSSGDNLRNVIPEEDMLSISKKYNAIEYKGWFRSNEVKLIVK